MRKLPLWKFVVIAGLLLALAIAFTTNALREVERRGEFAYAGAGIWIMLAVVVHNQFWGHKMSMPRRFLAWSIIVTFVGVFGTVGGLMKGVFAVIPAVVGAVGVLGLFASISWVRQEKRGP